MVESNRIGDARFATPLDLLPGERVLWSGGAQARSAWIHLGRTLLVFGLPMVAVVFFLLLPFAHRFASESRPEAAAPTSQQAARGETPAAASAPGKDAACPAPKGTASAKAKARAKARADAGDRILFGVAYAFFVLCLLYFLSLVVDCFLRVRHAWYVITSERICIQSGGWSRSLAVMDLDKIIAVKAESTWFEARMGLHSIELTHAGGTQVLRNAWQFLQPNAYSIAHVPTASPLLSELLNHWLPRDDRQPSPRAG